MIKIPHLLLVSGSNRNVGKTTFICQVISNIAKEKPIVGIKITPHFHGSRSQKSIILENEHVFISLENDNNSSKDSSLMLQNGASKVYYIEVKNDDYYDVVNFITKLQPEIPVICESASLRKFIEPGLFILIDNQEVKDKKPIFTELMLKADIIVTSDGQKFDFDIGRISFENNQWRIN